MTSVPANLKSFLKVCGLKFDTIPNSLEKLNLVRDGKLLNAAVLCFARKPEKFFPNTRLRCAVFGTLDTTVTISMQDFYGDVFYLNKKAEEYILEHINIGMRLDGLLRVGVGETTQKTSVKILGAIAEDNRITIPELAELAGVTVRSVERNIQRLQLENRLRRVGPDKGGYWEVVSNSA